MKKNKKKKNIKKNKLKRRFLFYILIAVILIVLITFTKQKPCVEESISAGNCEDGIDNDCDGKCDYDGCGNIMVGDEGCPVNIV